MQPLPAKIKVFVCEAEIAKFIMQKTLHKNPLQISSGPPPGNMQDYILLSRKGNEALKELVQAGIITMPSTQTIVNQNQQKSLVIALPPAGAPYAVHESGRNPDRDSGRHCSELGRQKQKSISR